MAERATLPVSAVRAFERGKGSARGHVLGSLGRACAAAGATLDAVIAALPAAGRPITVTEARRIVGAITGRLTGSLVLDRPAAIRPHDPALGPVKTRGLHRARPQGADGGLRRTANGPVPAVSGPAGWPAFHVALDDGRTGRLVVDRRAARPGAALVALASGTEEVDAAGLRIVRVD